MKRETICLPKNSLINFRRFFCSRKFRKRSVKMKKSGAAKFAAKLRRMNSYNSGFHLYTQDKLLHSRYNDPFIMNKIKNNSL